MYDAERLLNAVAHSDYRDLTEAMADAIGLGDAFRKYKQMEKEQIEAESKLAQEKRAEEAKKRNHLMNVCRDWVRHEWIPFEILSMRKMIDPETLFNFFLQQGIFEPSKYYDIDSRETNCW